MPDPSPVGCREHSPALPSLTLSRCDTAIRPGTRDGHQPGNARGYCLGRPVSPTVGRREHDPRRSAVSDRPARSAVARGETVLGRDTRDPHQPDDPGAHDANRPAAAPVGAVSRRRPGPRTRKSDGDTGARCRAREAPGTPHGRWEGMRSPGAAPVDRDHRRRRRANTARRAPAADLAHGAGRRSPGHHLPPATPVSGLGGDMGPGCLARSRGNADPDGRARDARQEPRLRHHSRIGPATGGDRDVNDDSGGSRSHRALAGRIARADSRTGDLRERKHARRSGLRSPRSSSVGRDRDQLPAPAGKGVDDALPWASARQRLHRTQVARELTGCPTAPTVCRRRHDVLSRRRRPDHGAVADRRARYRHGVPRPRRETALRPAPARVCRRHGRGHVLEPRPERHARARRRAGEPCHRSAVSRSPSAAPVQPPVACHVEESLPAPRVPTGDDADPRRRAGDGSGPTGRQATLPPAPATVLRRDDDTPVPGVVAARRDTGPRCRTGDPGNGERRAVGGEGAPRSAGPAGPACAGRRTATGHQDRQRH